jgi:hypothetical protein
MRAKAALTALATVVTGLAFAAPATSSPSRPVDLQVKGGEAAWHPENRFMIEWTNPATGNGPPLAAVHYRIRDPQGMAIEETRIGWVSDGIAAVTVPKAPGSYSVEVWLEDSSGGQGPSATARLRFDDVRPAPIEVEPAPRWIGRTTFPFRVRLGHPPGPAPISGIRGYAAAIGEPCAATDRCTDAETVLRGGIGDDTLAIAALPEGTSYLHAVAVSGSGMRSATSGRAVLRVDTTDPVTQLSGAPSGWTNRAVGLFASAADAGSGMAPDGGGPPPFTAIRIDDGAPAVSPGAYAIATVITEGAHRVAFYARDAAGNVDDGGDGKGVVDSPLRTAWVRIDRGTPSVAFANSEDPRDPDLLRVRVADALAGPDLSRGRIGVRPAGSGDRFQPLPPGPSGSGELRARWDSDAYPPGEYEFRAVGYDAAGNAAATTRRRNGAPMVLPSPLKAVTALGARLGAGVAERTVPYGRGIRLGGRLTTGRGSPLTGMPVRVVERFAAGAGDARVSPLRTGPGGAFSIRLAPGPSREVTVVFDGDSTLARSASRPLRLGVRTSVRLRASSAVASVGGAPLVFRGRVATEGGPIPRQGLPVQLQFRLSGLSWEEFRTVQTDRRGRFRYAYRFSDDDSRGARFQFRAYVPAQDDWPYEPGGSRPVIVRGR